MRSTALLLLTCLALAGCSGASKEDIDEAGPDLDLEGCDGGGIRGVALDEAVRPLELVTVRVEGQPDVRTGADGLFVFPCVPAGPHVVSASRPGFASASRPTVVEAGVVDPEMLRLTLARIPGQEPYAVTYKLDGMYECGVSVGTPVTPVMSDSCDFVVRTAYDEVNGTVPPPFPRHLQENVNGILLDIGPGAQTVIQEAFWDDPNVPTLMVELGSTPIDNACDCSDHYWLEEHQPSPTYGRVDASSGSFPSNQTVASRAFLDWDETSAATSFRFTLLTTVFYHYEPADGWTFETRDQHPV